MYSCSVLHQEMHGHCTVDACNTIEKVHVVYDFPWLLCVTAGCVVCQ